MITDIFIPGAITGFFDIHGSSEIAKAGTTGFSVCISYGLNIRAISIPSGAHRVRFYTQGKRRIIPVSRHVYDSFVPTLRRNYDITFMYYPQLPLGAGFGMSGATALGTAFCLNELQSNDNYGLVAYCADVCTKGGYGDIISQMKGGALLRCTPGFGSQIIEIDPKDYKVVCASFGPLSTKGVLESESTVENINKEGSKCLSKAMEDPSIEKLMGLSRSFSDKVSLGTPRLDWAIEDVSSVNSLPASMSMLGESLFTFAREEDISDILEALSPYEAEIMVADIWRGGIGHT